MGIGQALATRFIYDGHKVIASGRRQDRLEALLQEHGSEMLSIVPFDITKLHTIPEFAAE
jgi:NADP-dependent 3-hydroxy acid dehydrogenase YdfG